MDPIDDEIICCICHEILHNLHDKVTTICKHTYCVSCFIKWMRISNNCAYCKNNLINNYLDASFQNLDISGNLNVQGDASLNSNVDISGTLK